MTRLGRLTFLTLMAIFNLAVGGCATGPASSCGPEVRAGLDIGSGTSKMKVGLVDTCRGTLLKELLSSQLKIDYKDDLAQSQSKEFSKEIQRKGLESILRFRREAERFNPARWKAVATAAFREAKNGQVFARAIETQTGIRVHVISQSEEARLGFLAAQSASDPSAGPMAVWDIGGGSQQISTLDEHGEIQSYRNELGSVAFKNEVLALQNKNPKSQPSPNPVGKATFLRALKRVQIEAARARTELGPGIWKAQRVVGIGGVHTQSIRNQVKVDFKCSIQDLDQSISERIHWSDQRIGGDYAATDVTNLILVYGFMKELGIETVTLAQVNLTDILLVGTLELLKF